MGNCKGLTSLGLTLLGGQSSRPKANGLSPLWQRACRQPPGSPECTAVIAASLLPAGVRQLMCISEATLQDPEQHWSRVSTGLGLTQSGAGTAKDQLL